MLIFSFSIEPCDERKDITSLHLNSMRHLRRKRGTVRLDPVKFRFTVMFFEEGYSFKADSFSCGLDVRYSILSFATQSKCAMKCIRRKIPVHD